MEYSPSLVPIHRTYSCCIVGLYMVHSTTFPSGALQFTGGNSLPIYSGITNRDPAVEMRSTREPFPSPFSCCSAHKFSDIQFNCFLSWFYQYFRNPNWEGQAFCAFTRATFHLPWNSQSLRCLAQAIMQKDQWNIVLDGKQLASE